MNSSICSTSISCYSPKLKLSSTNFVPFCSSNLKFKTLAHTKLSVKCSSSKNPGSGETESNGLLDAFFLGKALAETINERIESTVGEVLSVVGRLQAEQQKQVQEFQEDVLERAKKAKDQAAREVLEAQGPSSKPTTTVAVSAVDVSGPIVVSPDSSAGSYDSSKKNSPRDPFVSMMMVEED
ncbi:hypothetical protein ACHQM5_027708 [Ranunculus cassubicifolius]